MTQDSRHNRDDYPQPDDTASPVDSPAQAADAGRDDTGTAPQGGTRRVGESGVGAQRDEASEFTTPTGDGNYRKEGDRDVGITGEDEAQQ